MERLIIIGNIGADAQIQDFNGSKFISFRVACSNKMTVNGQEQVSTQWYDVTSSRVDGKIFDYLKKGVKVCVIGRPKFTMYDSQVHRCKMISVQLFAETIELCGSAGENNQQQHQQQQQAVQAGEPAPF